MNYYETLLIIHPALEAGRLKDIILSIEENLKKENSSILSIDLWGKKRLAYLIEKQKFGTYVKLQFSGKGNCIKNLEIELQHNSNILSYLTTLISESNISDQRIDLDDQIAGHSRETLSREEKNKKSDVIKQPSDQSNGAKLTEEKEEESDLEVGKTSENDKKSEKLNKEKKEISEESVEE